MADFIDDISINTIIGPGTFVNGSLSVPGFLRVDGDINGDIKMQESEETYMPSR